MKKTTEKTEINIVKNTEVFCDICRRKIDLQVYSLDICEFCGRDICQKCAEISPEDIGGDCTRYICLKCVEIVKPFYTQLELLDEQKDKIHSEMEVECIKQKVLTNENN